MDQHSALVELEKQLKELMKTAVGRRAFLASIPGLLVACASADKTRHREGDNSGQMAALTPNEEKRLTAKALKDMRKDYPLARDAQLQTYVRGLGKKLVVANGLHQKPYTYSFAVVDVPYVNAFALPAGTVFVTAPLLEMAETEAELMGVIGHEVGHVQARHTAERMYAAEQAQKKTWKYALGGGLLGAAAGYGAGKLLCKPRDSKCLANAAALGAAAGAGGGLLIQKYGFMANSREDEMEADRIGFRTAVGCGYHKNHVGSFYAKLLKMEKASNKSGVPVLSSIADAMSTHPPSQERVNQMNEMAASQPLKKTALISSNQFSQMRRKASLIARRARARAKRKKG